MPREKELKRRICNRPNHTIKERKEKEKKNTKRSKKNRKKKNDDERKSKEKEAIRQKIKSSTSPTKQAEKEAE